MRKALVVAGFFAASVVGLAILMTLVIMVIYGGPTLASYVAGLFGLGAIAEMIITVSIMASLPAALLTYLKFND
jgi:hypothetical protein